MDDGGEWLSENENGIYVGVWGNRILPVIELHRPFSILYCNFDITVLNSILIFVAFQLNRFTGHLTLNM